MKQVIIASAFLFIFISCDDHKNAGSGSNLDSASVNSLVPDSANNAVSSKGASATGTTGTGAVSDSGNAAHPGSDTSHITNSSKSK